MLVWLAMVELYSTLKETILDLYFQLTFYNRQPTSFGSDRIKNTIRLM